MLVRPAFDAHGGLRHMLGDVVERVFDGSAKAVVLSLFDCAQIDADELKELRRLIADKSKEWKS